MKKLIQKYDICLCGIDISFPLQKRHKTYVTIWCKIKQTNNSILKNRIFYKKEGSQFRMFYIMHTAAPYFHSTEIDNVHEGNPMFQVISVCSNVWEHSKSIFTIANVFADRSKLVT